MTFCAQRVGKHRYDVVIVSRYNPREGGGLEGVVREQTTSFLNKGLKIAVFFRRRMKNEKFPMDVDSLTIEDRISSFSGAIADVIYAIPTYFKIARINMSLILDNFEFPILYKILSKVSRKKALIIKVHHGTPNYLESYSGLRGLFAKVYSIFLKPVYALSSKKVDLNIAVSYKVKKELVKDYKIPTERIIVIHNGININRFKPRSKILSRKKTGFAKDKKIILFIGNDLERKCFKEALQIVKALRNDCRNLLFIVITSEEVKINANWIKVLQNVPHEQMPFIYNASNILLLPSRYEVGLTLTVLEALASGCPAVVSLNAAEEKYNGEGYLIAHNYNDYREYCRKLLEDEEYWNKMSQKGRNLAILEYSINKQHEAYSKLIASI